MTKLFALLAVFGLVAAPAFAAEEHAKPAEKAAVDCSKAADKAACEKEQAAKKDMKEAAPAAGEKTVKKDEAKH